MDDNERWLSDRTCQCDNYKYPHDYDFQKNSQRCFDHLLAHLVAYGQIEPSDVYDVTSITINSSGTLEWAGKAPSQLEDGNATAA